MQPWSHNVQQKKAIPESNPNTTLKVKLITTGHESK
jgi:hypothetical protein